MTVNIMKKNKHAFTMAELMVAVALLSLILSQVFAAFGFGNRLWATGAEKLTMQSAARNVMTRLTRDVRLSDGMVASVTLDTAGDAAVISQPGAAVIYSIAVENNKNVLYRNSTVIASGLESIQLVNDGKFVNISITISTDHPQAMEDEYILTAKVRKRNV